MEGSAGKSGGKGTGRKPAAKRPRAKGASKPRAKAAAKPGRAPAKAPSKRAATVGPSKAGKGKGKAGSRTSKTAAASKARKPAKKPAARDAKAPKDPSRDLWFRFSTRVRALGYWGREKGQALARGVRPAAGRAGDFWVARSPRERIGIGAGAAVLLLLVLVRIVPVPGVPCQVSVKECPPDQQSLELVPADALMYAHLTLDRDSDQFERASEHFDRLADLRAILTAELPGALAIPSRAPLDLAQDVLPWADRDLALTLLPGRGRTSREAFIVGIGDRDGAEEFVAKVAPGGQPSRTDVGGAELSEYNNGFAVAYVGDALVFGDGSAVRAAAGTAAGDVPALSDGEGSRLLERLPEARFAEIFLSRSGVQRLLAGRPGAATQLETFVDYGATEGLAAAAVAADDGIELDLLSELNPKLLGKNPSFFSELPDFEPDLAQEAGSRSLAYVGVGEVGPTLVDLLERAGGSGEGVAGSLRSLASRLRREAGIDPLSQLLPALGGQAALVAEPTDGVPFASLIVDDVDTEQAAEALAALQRPLLRALGTSGGARVPRFEESELEGVEVRSVQASPTVNLSYALLDGRLVVSTDPAGIAQVAAGGDSLADSDPFERATDELPDEVSALVFLNLDELFGQVTRTDLVEDPFFANLSVLFDNATSMALAVNGEEEEISSELFLAID